MLLTTAPRLRIRRPSPTAAEFTVTTQAPATQPLRVLCALLVVLRGAVCLAALLVLHARWATGPLGAGPPPSVPPPLPSSELLALWLAAQRTRPVAAAVARTPLPLLLAAAAAVLFLASRRVHARESLLVLRGLGVQTTEAPRSYLAAAATRFIPTERILDILVNEAFRGFEVRYYLVVVVDGQEDVVVVFPGLLPRRDIVETVWRAARECLYEGRAGHKGHVV